MELVYLFVILGVIGFAGGTYNLLMENRKRHTSVC